MTTLAEVRTELDSVLTTAGLTVDKFVKALPQPPVAVITPAGDWITPADEFCGWDLTFNISIITKYGTNETQTIELDTLTTKALIALQANRQTTIQSVQPPGKLTIGNANYLVSIITAVKNTELTNS